MTEAEVERIEGWLHAFAFRPPAPPVVAAGGDGPLADLVVGVKDIIDTADMPTEYGSEVFRGHRPTRDAAIVTLLREAGASVFGKTATTEFAWRHPAATVNPWNPAHTPGGSSSGSAASVAAGIVPLAVGTQTVGSVIRPAAFCGVVGFKPSFGVLPTEGVHPFAPSLDHLGLFAREAATVGRAMGALAGVTAETVAAPRLVLLRELRPELVSEAQAAALERVARALAAAGAVVEEAVLPASFDTVWAELRVVLAFEAAAGYGALIDREPDRTSAVLRELVEEGRAIGEAAYRRALAAQGVLREALGRFLDGHDALLTVPAPGIAPRGLSDTGDATFCAPWSFTGVPAVTLPAGWSEGLPLGVQLVGAFGTDARLLGVARWVEEAAPAPAR